MMKRCFRKADRLRCKTPVLFRLLLLLSGTSRHCQCVPSLPVIKFLKRKKQNIYDWQKCLDRMSEFEYKL